MRTNWRDFGAAVGTIDSFFVRTAILFVLRQVVQPLEHPPQGGIGKLDVQRNHWLILLVRLIATEPKIVRDGLAITDSGVETTLSSDYAHADETDTAILVSTPYPAGATAMN